MKSVSLYMYLKLKNAILLLYKNDRQSLTMAGYRKLIAIYMIVLVSAAETAIEV